MLLAHEDIIVGGWSNSGKLLPSLGPPFQFSGSPHLPWSAEQMCCVTFSKCGSCTNSFYITWELGMQTHNPSSDVLPGTSYNVGISSPLSDCEALQNNCLVTMPARV
jgi:hypothetical protein